MKWPPEGVPDEIMKTKNFNIFSKILQRCENTPFTIMERENRMLNQENQELKQENRMWKNKCEQNEYNRFEKEREWIHHMTKMECYWTKRIQQTELDMRETERLNIKLKEEKMNLMETLRQERRKLDDLYFKLRDPDVVTQFAPVEASNADSVAPVDPDDGPVANVAINTRKGNVIKITTLDLKEKRKRNE